MQWRDSLSSIWDTAPHPAQNSARTAIKTTIRFSISDSSVCGPPLTAYGCCCRVQHPDLPPQLSSIAHSGRCTADPPVLYTEGYSATGSRNFACAAATRSAQPKCLPPPPCRKGNPSHRHWHNGQFGCKVRVSATCIPRLFLLGATGAFPVDAR